MINDNQLTVSYELLYLMQWLLDREPAKLKGLIVQALQNGLKEDIQTAANSTELRNLEDIQYSIVDFLTLLETLLSEAINEHAFKKMMEKKLMPAINHIDNNECDQETVDFSVEKASSKL